MATSLLMLLMLAATSAYELPSVSRRALIARAAATTPLTAVATAWADANNDFLGKGKAELGRGSVEKYGTVDRAVGREAVVDDSGAAVPITTNPAGMPSTAKFTAKEASQDTAGYSAGIRISGTYLDQEGAKIKVQTIGTNKLLVTDLSSTSPKGNSPSGLILARGFYDGRAVEIGGLSISEDDGLKGTAVLMGIIFQDGSVWKKLP